MEPEIIQQKALELFSKHGTQAVNMDCLARELTISKKTLYKHFESKEALVYSLLEQVIEEWGASLDTILQGKKDPVSRLLAFELLRYDYLQRFNPEFLVKKATNYDSILDLQDIIKEQVSSIYYCLLEDAKDKGYLIECLDIHTFIKTHEMTFELFVEKCLSNTAQSHESFKHLVMLHTAGIVNQRKIDVWPVVEELLGNRNLVFQ
ncbi:TetR/AcrR family transcriptional regulator [Limibacter armeniacum]|uniref:TetR/AcrR family transcriptional regulator n=1 Tax=Limibacter armeniacum TaxID=466084 RepID=UPI002FE53BD1